MDKKTIIVYGTDKRMEYLAFLLRSHGYEVKHFESIEKNIIKGDVYIFPIGTSCEEVACAFDMNPISKIFVPNNKIVGEGIFDYLNDEEVVLKNAVATSEGAIEIAIRESKKTIFESKILIFGFGRVAKPLSKAMCALGADVYIAARKKIDRTVASLEKYSSMSIDEALISLDRFDIIFNTVPTRIIEKEHLEKMRNDSLLIDLASKPGGVDFSCAEELGKKVVWALGLPGKTAPLSAAEYIFEYITRKLEEILL